MSLRDLRRTLGKARYNLLHGARDRRLLAAAEAARDGWVQAATDALPPLPAPPAEVATEVHTMCGEKQAVMGIWASWSLLRHLPDARLVVHSDGTLGAATAERWRRAVPGLRLVSLDEGRAATATRLAAFPHIRDWAERYHFGIKLGGFQSLLDAPRLIDMDTDTLTFRDPQAVRDALAPGGPQLAWNRDATYCYAYPEALLREIAGDLVGPLPHRLNGGYMVAFRLEDRHWALLDELVRRFAEDPRTDHLRYWMHQTLVALLAAAPDVSAAPLPAPYDIHAGPCRPDAVMRHFVGAPGIRPRFYTEGIGLVIGNARADGTLPADFFRDAVPDGRPNGRPD